MKKTALELGRCVSENPFAGDAGEWQAAAERLLAIDRTTLFDDGFSRLGNVDASTLLLGRLLAEATLGGHALEEVLAVRRTPERLLQRAECRRSELSRLLGAALRCQQALAKLVGESLSLKAVRSAAWSACFGSSLGVTLRLERVIREHDVLIAGETGTGKEAVAHAIGLGTLGGSGGGQAPFAALNIAAIPETLIESELFGHVRGAFTGAGKNRVGHIRSVGSGCLFLDEVGDLPATAQSKLLRVMETDMVTPLGSDATYHADVRYIAATHKDLRAMAERGAFRADLYERLAGNVIRLPALRERPDDIEAIGTQFAARYVSRDAPEWSRVKRFLASSEALSHRWPGNVRELQNCLRNVLLGVDAGLREVPPALEDAGSDVPDDVRQGFASMDRVAGWYLTRVLARVSGNYAEAARSLGLDRTTVRRKARLLG